MSDIQYNKAAEALGLGYQYNADCAEILSTIERESVDLVVTSPPYNIGKSYERKARLEDYVDFQRQIIADCYRILAPNGSVC